jgi:hypothetical protein
MISFQTDGWCLDWQPWLASAVQSHSQTWVCAPTNSPLHAWLKARYPPLSQHKFDGWVRSGWNTQ